MISVDLKLRALAAEYGVDYDEEMPLTEFARLCEAAREAEFAAASGPPTERNLKPWSGDWPGYDGEYES